MFYVVHSFNHGSTDGCGKCTSDGQSLRLHTDRAGRHAYVFRITDYGDSAFRITVTGLRTTTDYGVITMTVHLIVPVLVVSS